MNENEIKGKQSILMKTLYAYFIKFSMQSFILFVKRSQLWLTDWLSDVYVT